MQLYFRDTPGDLDFFTDLNHARAVDNIWKRFAEHFRLIDLNRKLLILFFFHFNFPSHEENDDMAITSNLTLITFDKIA